MIIIDRDGFGAIEEPLLPRVWPEESRGIIISAGTEYSIIKYLANQIKSIVDSRPELCAHQVDQAIEVLLLNRAQMETIRFYAEVPAIHVAINGFFGHVKGLLDTLVQLLSTQRIVTNKIHGFHKANDKPGEKVLKALQNNSSASAKRTVQELIELFARAKCESINSVVSYRDRLTHMRPGSWQLMFGLRFDCHKDPPQCVEIVPPAFSGKPVDDFAEQTLSSTTRFIEAFLSAVRHPS